jgi:hypothetical protein
MPKRKPARPRYSWRDTPESAIRSLPSWPSPLSLNPGPEVILAAVCGSPEARAIVSSYSGCVLRVTIMEVSE